MSRAQNTRGARTRRAGTSARLLATVGAVTAALGSVLVVDATPIGAEETEEVQVSNVAASLTAPVSAPAAFEATATISNVGNIPQLSGATVTITATGGSVTAAPAGCLVGGGQAICTTTSLLLPGESQSYTATVTPSAGATEVTTTAVTQANQPDLNAPASPADDTATASTIVEVSNVVASLVVPTTTEGGFTATATVTNTGNMPQAAGATVTIKAVRATVAAPGCAVVNAAEVRCTAGALPPGAGQAFDATVTPALAVGNPATVVTTAVTKANQPDVNAPGSPADDTVTKSTAVQVRNVAASLSAPGLVTGPFTVTGAITNTGNVPQIAGGTVRISAVGGSVAAAGCAQDGTSAVVCTAGALNVGQAQSFPATVTPGAVGTVATSVLTTAAQPDLNAPASPADDTATANTNHYALALDLTNDPDTVKPGSDTKLDAALTNNGLPQSGINLVIDTGGVVDTRLPLSPGCLVDVFDSGRVNCLNISLGTGETKHFVVAVTTPNNESPSITSVATATGQQGTSATDEVVTALDPGAKGAYVPPGGTACSTESHESTCVSVPSTWEGGTVVTLNQRTDLNLQCGDQVCYPYVVEAKWPKSDNPAHLDPNQPLVLQITYAEKQSCNGKGWGAGCHQLYWLFDEFDTEVKVLTHCPTYQNSQRLPARMSDADTPCLNFVYRNQNGIVTYEVAFLVDPLIPKISL